MGTIKDRNSIDLREAEDIKKRCQEYIEVAKKSLFVLSISYFDIDLISININLTVGNKLPLVLHFH